MIYFSQRAWVRETLSASCSVRRPPLYPTLWHVAEFVKSLESPLITDADERRKAAIARYVAELPASELFACRRDWRSFAGVT